LLAVRVELLVDLGQIRRTEDDLLVGARVADREHPADGPVGGKHDLARRQVRHAGRVSLDRPGDAVLAGGPDGVGSSPDQHHLAAVLDLVAGRGGCPAVAVLRLGHLVALERALLHR
jgi:hypothetical protein